MPLKQSVNKIKMHLGYKLRYLLSLERCRFLHAVQKSGQAPYA